MGKAYEGQLNTIQSIFWWLEGNFLGGHSKFGVICVEIWLKIIEKTHLINL
jgi:hypothetical protein